MGTKIDDFRAIIELGEHIRNTYLVKRTEKRADVLASLAVILGVEAALEGTEFEFFVDSIVPFMRAGYTIGRKQNFDRLIHQITEIDAPTVKRTKKRSKRAAKHER